MLPAREVKGKKREKYNKTPTTHWIIIFKSWDLENKQNVMKNFYSAFCLLIFLLLCVRLFFHLKLTSTEHSSDGGWDNPFRGELRALIACLDSFPSFFPTSLYLFCCAEACSGAIKYVWRKWYKKLHTTTCQHIMFSNYFSIKNYLGCKDFIHKSVIVSSTTL